MKRKELVISSCAPEQTVKQLKQLCIDKYCDLSMEYKDIAKQHAQKGKEFDRKHGTRCDAARAIALGSLSSEINAVNKEIGDIVEFYTTKLGGKVEDFPRIIEITR